MSRFLAALATLAILATPLPASAAGGEAEKTLSPYFFIENGDPTVDQLPLMGTAVHIDVAGVIADVKVNQTYRNGGTRPINARYVFPASTRAAVHGLRMIIGAEVIVAKIKRREEARADFEKAKEEGKNASLLEEDRPNVFSMQVANVMPGQTIVVELRYTELLVPTDGTYEVVYPTVVGPRYSNEPAGLSAAADKYVASAYAHAGVPPTSTLTLDASVAAGMPIRALASPSHKIATHLAADGSHTDVALDASEDHGGDRDFILRYKLAGDAVSTGLILEQDADENHFLVIAQPPARVKPEEIPPREYIFIIDVSGSMGGFPLGTAKDLIAELAVRLRRTDTFNILFFSGGSELLAPRSMPATPDNIMRAVAFVDSTAGGGGTELLPAMQRALALPREDGRARTFIVITDGYISAEKAVFDHIRDHLGDANVFAFGIGSAVNRYLIEGIARAGKAEPFIVTEPAKAGEAARKFRDYIEAPVLTHVRLETDGLDVYDVEPRSIPDVFADRPVIIHGKWRGARHGTLRVTGVSGSGPYSASFDVGSVAPSATQALRQLWARTRIATLSDFGDSAEDEVTKEAVVALGLKYNLLTRFTSFIAVREKVVNTGAAASDVEQPLPMPEGVADSAIGMESGDEPGLLAVAAGLLLALAFFHRRRAAA